MNKTLSFVKLDFITIKPYLTLKTLIPFTVMVFIMGFSFDNSSWLIGFYMFFFAIVCASYPFAVGEQSGIDTLYSTLSIRRETVVLGRYIYALCITALSGIAVYILSVISSLVSQKTFNYTEGLIVLAAIFIICGIMQAFQLPVYFKLGYAKAKVIIYVPLVIPSAGVVVFSTVFKDYDIQESIINWFNKIADKPYIIALIGVGIWLITLGISYKISLLFYKKRDF